MKFFLINLFLGGNLAFAANEVVISGQQCMGQEVTEASMNGEWTSFTCPREEWLIEIQNTTPFIAKLNLSTVKRSEIYTYYNIVPSIPVEAKVRWILRQHLVRVYQDGEIGVVHK